MDTFTDAGTRTFHYSFELMLGTLVLTDFFRVKQDDTKAGSSSFDGSDPLPGGKGFKEGFCSVSGIRDYGCGFAKNAGGVD